MTTMIAAAKFYMNKMGFSVIPLKPKDKRPFVSWKDYQERKATDEELSEWFMNSQNNLGIVTGAISGIAVVDCDNADAVELATKLGIGDGPRVITGKGQHFYFRYTQGLRNFQKREDLPGIDLRADGGYVVGPPSIHPSGAIYQWAKDSIKKLLPEFPKWVISQDQLNQQNTERKSSYQGTSKGSRNMTLARMAGFWVREMPLQDAIEMALTWNVRNQPPLPDSEVRTTVESIFKAEQRKRSEQVDEDPILRAVSVDSVLERVKTLYEHGIPSGMDLGWKSVEPLYKPRRGEWTLVTGIPGSGKSEFLDNIVIRLAIAGWKIAIFSAEKQPIEAHVASLVEKYAGIPFEETRYSQRITEEDLARVMASLNRQICFIEFPDDDANLQKILASAKALKEKAGLDGLIIDPWGELEHNLPQNLSETLYISQTLTRVRRFARQNSVHIWLVAHPTKLRKKENGEYDVPTPYDVSGSAAWRNKADMAIAVYRHMKDKDKPVEIHVQKVRFKKVGKIGTALLKYDWETGRYSDV